MEFSYDTTLADGVAIFRLEGSILDKSQTEGLLAEVDRQLDNKHNKVILSFKKINYLNSAGLNVLINILTKVRNAYGDVLICELPEKVNRLLVISKLNTVFKSVPTEVDAINELTSKM